MGSNSGSEDPLVVFALVDPSGASNLQAERRVTGRTHFAPRAITVEPVGEFIAPGGASPASALAGESEARLDRQISARAIFDSRPQRRRSCPVPGCAMQRKGLQWATANFSTQRTIHESQSFEIVPVRAKRTTGREATGILAFFATLPRDQRRAKFTMPRQNSRKGRFVFKGRSSSVDFLPMTLRTRFLITALFLCHQLLAAALVTRQLLSGNSDQAATSSVEKDAKTREAPASASNAPCARAGREPGFRFGHHLRRPAGKRRRRLQTARQRRNSLSQLCPEGR